MSHIFSAARSAAVATATDYSVRYVHDRRDAAILYTAIASQRDFAVRMSTDAATYTLAERQDWSVYADQLTVLLAHLPKSDDGVTVQADWRHAWGRFLADMRRAFADPTP